jgi:predicted ATPase
MTSLGEILLKFGATGAEGEEPLHFKTAHINLLVGPNNAGKSLMLRELSNVNPRDRRRSGGGLAQNHIVNAVQWADKVERSLQQEVLSAVFAAREPAWVELRSKSWDQLLPALEDAAKQFTDIRDRLCPTLFELLITYLPENAFWGLLRSDVKMSTHVAISVAIVSLQLTRMNIAAAAAATSDLSGSLAVPRVGPLTSEQAAVVQQALEEIWGRCEAALVTLGVSVHGISVANLLEMNGLGSALWGEMARNPLLHRLLPVTSEIVERENPSALTLDQMRRFAAAEGWLVDPEPLERLAQILRETYASVVWSNPSRRDSFAREVLYLDGLARLEVTSSVKLTAKEHHGNGQPVILTFLKSPELRERLRALTVDALDAHLVVDMTTHAPHVVWRLAQEAPPKGLENTFYIGDTNPFLEAAALLDDRSDGIHAFVGMLAAILAKPADLVFIDEPEAFLHPPLVRKLARQLAELARVSGRQFFIATHSADLLESFVSVGVEVNIIRLTHDSERSTARLLDSDALRRLARDAEPPDV